MFTVPAEAEQAISALARELGVPLTKIGAIEAGAGVRVTDAGRRENRRAVGGISEDFDLTAKAIGSPAATSARNLTLLPFAPLEGDETPTLQLSVRRPCAAAGNFGSPYRGAGREAGSVPLTCERTARGGVRLRCTMDEGRQTGW